MHKTTHISPRVGLGRGQYNRCANGPHVEEENSEALKKEEDNFPDQFKIIEEKKYGISKIIFGKFI